MKIVKLNFSNVKMLIKSNKSNNYLEELVTEFLNGVPVLVEKNDRAKFGDIIIFGREVILEPRHIFVKDFGDFFIFQRYKN